MTFLKVILGLTIFLVALLSLIDLITLFLFCGTLEEGFASLAILLGVPWYCCLPFWIFAFTWLHPAPREFYTTVWWFIRHNTKALWAEM